MGLLKQIFISRKGISALQPHCFSNLNSVPASRIRPEKAQAYDKGIFTIVGRANTFNGKAYLCGRRGRDKAQLLRSRRPYTQWQRKELDRYIGGPLLTRWGGRYVVGGRKIIGDRGPSTSMCWLLNDQLHEFAELPSGGDNSYPGFVEITPNRAVMSWYSSHETDAEGKTITAIYMADLEIVE